MRLSSSFIIMLAMGGKRLLSMRVGAFAIIRRSPAPYPRNNRSISFLSSRLYDSSNSPDLNEPTWEYVPYNNPSKQQQRKRPFVSSTSWKVPKSIDIPTDELDFSFVRSSGSGGQNVNKVNTKVVVRWHVPSASPTWLPTEVKDRLLKQSNNNNINKDGYWTVTSQEYRTQLQNRKHAVRKLETFILQAWPRPVVRKVKKGPTQAQKRRNVEQKRRKSQVKQSRGRVDW